MGQQAWKSHELATAKYFNTTRRYRGGNFAVSDVEIKASVNQWLERDDTADITLLVECKYSKKHGIVKLFHELRKENNGIVIMTVENFIFCDMSDFCQVFKDFIDPFREQCNIDDISSKYSIIRTSRQLPTYISEYWEQAEKYIPMHFDASKMHSCIPLVSLAKANAVGRVIAFDVNSLPLSN